MSESLTAFSNGADIVAANLVRMRNLAPLLPIRAQKKILNDMSGSYGSFIKGRGMDFAEVRQYQSGDDLRAMDWRVTARTGDAHIKIFHEEKERPVLIVCDLRANMQFGSKRALKSVLAADIAALLAWSALDAGDRIGALLFNDDSELDLRPKTGRKAVLHLLSEIVKMPRSSGQDPQARMQQICRHIRRITRPGTRVYFISDWLGFDNNCQEQLFNVTRHSDVVAIHISDPLEQQLPPPGLYTLSDGINEAILNSAAANVRDKFSQAYQQRLQQLRQQLLALRTPLIKMVTANPHPLSDLRVGLGLSPLTNSVMEHSQ